MHHPISSSCLAILLNKNFNNPVQQPIECKIQRTFLSPVPRIKVPSEFHHSGGFTIPANALLILSAAPGELPIPYGATFNIPPGKYGPSATPGKSLPSLPSHPKHPTSMIQLAVFIGKRHRHQRCAPPTIEINQHFDAELHRLSSTASLCSCSRFRCLGSRNFLKLGKARPTVHLNRTKPRPGRFLLLHGSVFGKVVRWVFAHFPFSSRSLFTRNAAKLTFQPERNGVGHWVSLALELATSFPNRCGVYKEASAHTHTHRDFSN